MFAIACIVAMFKPVIDLKKKKIAKLDIDIAIVGNFITSNIFNRHEFKFTTSIFNQSIISVGNDSVS